MTYEEEMKLAYKNLAVAALEAQTAVLLHALKQAEPILDAASATAREDGGTMIPGARPAWDAVRAAIALERFPVSRDTEARDTGIRSQNIVVIGSGHLLSILAENARLRAALAWYLEDDKRSVDDGTLENIRDRPAFAALQEQEAKP